MAGSGTPPPPANYKQDINQYLGALKNVMPGLVGLEGKYRDDFGSMNLADIQGMVGGYGDQMGLMGLNRLYGAGMSDQIGDMRWNELQRMQNQSGLARNLMQGLSPEAASMLRQSGQVAQGSLDRFRDFNQADPSMQLLGGANYQVNQAQQRANRFGRQDQSDDMIQRSAKDSAVAHQQFGDFSKMDPTLGLLGSAGMAANAAQSAANRYGQQDQSQAMIRQAVQDANAAQLSAQGLTGGERRSAEQFAREGAADRGRVMDNSAMAAEVLNRDDVLARKRAEASQLTNNAYNMANQYGTQLRGEAAGLRGDALNQASNVYGQRQGAMERATGNTFNMSNMFNTQLRGEAANARSDAFGMAGNLFNQRFGAQQATNQNTFNQANQFYTQPGLQALSMTPQGFQAGQNMLNLGIGAIGQNTPQLVDLGMGFNLGAAERQNLAGLYAANQAASAARAAGKDAKTGSIFEGIGNVIGGLLG